MSENANLSKLEGLAGNEQGIYTLHGVDLKRIFELEDERSLLVRNMSQMSELERFEKFQDILSEMQIFLESYHFDDYLKARYVSGYTFYDVVSQLPMFDGDLDFCRKGAEIAFTAWRECIRKLGATLPTHQMKGQTSKDKIVNRMLNLAGQIDMVKFIDEYRSYGLRDSNLNFLGFTCSRAYRYDLDINLMIVGKARSSKSTLAANLFELVYGYRDFDIYFNERYKRLIDLHYILSNQQGMTSLKEARKGDVNWFDELSLTFDRRRSLSRMQIQTSEMLNFYASNNGVNLFLIQNFTDADQRIVTKSTGLIIVLERGFGMMFSDAKLLPIFRDQFGLEKIMENPSIGKDRELAYHMLRSMKEYICDIRWNDRGAHIMEDNRIENNGDDLYAYALKKKIERQQEMKIMLNEKSKK